jgi:hypothetical protein
MKIFKIRQHFDSFLLLAGFILMASGGGELVFSDQNPESAGAVSNPESSGDFLPEGILFIPIFPLPLAASDPEQPLVNAVAPEVAAAEAPEEIVPDYTGALESEATGNMLRFIEGAFGALIMVCAGLGAIVAAAFGGYKVAISLLFVAVGAFILRALVSLFFGGGFEATGVGEFVG